MYMYLNILYMYIMYMYMYKMVKFHAGQKYTFFTYNTVCHCQRTTQFVQNLWPAPKWYRKCLEYLQSMYMS